MTTTILTVDVMSDYEIEKDKIHIFTDGACSGNPGPMGIGCVYVHIDDSGNETTKEIAESIGVGTNNIAELTAIKRGLEGVKRRSMDVVVHTDSRYSIGALTGKNKVRANAELISTITELMKDFNNVTFRYVAGHSGNKYNEKADQLATCGAWCF